MTISNWAEHWTTRICDNVSDNYLFIGHSLCIIFWEREQLSIIFSIVGRVLDYLRHHTQYSIQHREIIAIQNNCNCIRWFRWWQALHDTIWLIIFWGFDCRIYYFTSCHFTNWCAIDFLFHSQCCWFFIQNRNFWILTRK